MGPLHSGQLGALNIEVTEVELEFCCICPSAGLQVTLTACRDNIRCRLAKYFLIKIAQF